MEISKKPIPSYGINIDKEGNWYYRGEKMFRKEIIALFYQHLTIDSAGRYIIEIENDQSVVEVEDCPFVIKTIYMTENHAAKCYALLSDGSLELIDLKTIKFDKENVPRCRVKNGIFEARFSRPAYYQLVEKVEFDETAGEYFVNIGNENIFLKIDS